MMLKKIILIMFFATSISTLTFANTPFSSTKISSLIMMDGGTDIVIELKSNVANQEGCKIFNQIVLKRTNPLFKETYAALLSAFHMHTTITGWVNGCSIERNTADMPILTRLDLKK